MKGMICCAVLALAAQSAAAKQAQWKGKAPAKGGSKYYWNGKPPIDGAGLSEVLLDSGAICVVCDVRTELGHALRSNLC